MIAISTKSCYSIYSYTVNRPSCFNQAQLQSESVATFQNANPCNSWVVWRTWHSFLGFIQCVCLSRAF